MGIGVWGLPRAWGLGFRVMGLRFRVQGLGFRAGWLQKMWVREGLKGFTGVMAGLYRIVSILSRDSVRSFRDIP